MCDVFQKGYGSSRKHFLRRNVNAKKRHQKKPNFSYLKLTRGHLMALIQPAHPY